MSIAEAALYGNLVKHLRDVCAQQLAELKGISIESERTLLDDVIRAWFFAPQDDLYGLTPQRVIRNEALGFANTIPVPVLAGITHAAAFDFRHWRLCWPELAQCSGQTGP